MFRIPQASVSYWMSRLVARGATGVERAERFGEGVITFRDPDGMRLGLAALPAIESEPAWNNGEVPAEHAIRGFHGVTLLLGRRSPRARS